MSKDLHNVIITCMAFFNFDNNNDNDNYYNNNKIIKIILSFSLPVNLKIFSLDSNSMQFDRLLKMNYIFLPKS